MHPNQQRAAHPSRPPRIVSVLAHIFLFSVSLLTSFVLAYNFAEVNRWFFPQFMMALPAFLLVKHLVFSLLRQYQRSWRYAGHRDLFSAAAACTLASIILQFLVIGSRTWFADSRLHGIVMFPDSVLWIDWITSVALVSCARYAVRFYLEQGRASGITGPRKLIVGAGDAGETLLREIQRMPVEKHHIVGFLDDDAKKCGTRIHGVEVLGSVSDIRRICNTRRIEEVLIAIPSAPQRRIREIVQLCEGAHVSFRIVPGLSELIEGTGTIESQPRRIKLEDLLTRQAVVLDPQAIGQYLQNKKVLITGAGGSIGSELCRQILHFRPQKLILVEQSENNLFDIERELSSRSAAGGAVGSRQYSPSASNSALSPGAPGHPALSFYLADVCDRERMSTIFEGERPDIVCHAAAHKHVPMLEAHPGEGIKNNVVGTKTLADLAVEVGVQKFVYISTDKAVNPTSIMGCTKRIAEIYIQGLSDHSKTQFITVRFGNVLGSRGSVVPIFQEQITRGGPVTVTHPEITRYFMTLPEASQLVLQAGSIGNGGEIFLLNMGEPAKIVDLARNLITLSGLTPDVDIEIVFTGLRPGEKLYEELYVDGEGLCSTSNPNIRVWQKRHENWSGLGAAIRHLVRLADGDDVAEIKQHLLALVPEYQIDYLPRAPQTTKDISVVKVST